MQMESKAASGVGRHDSMQGVFRVPWSIKCGYPKSGWVLSYIFEWKFKVSYISNIMCLVS